MDSPATAKSAEFLQHLVPRPAPHARLRSRLTGIVLLFPIFLAAQGGLVAQRSRRGGTPGSTMNAPPMKGVVISVHGTLKELSKKTILIQADDNQMMTLRRTSKTKFMSNEKEVKPFEIDLDTTVSIDVTEDNDLKLLALTLRVDPGQKKRPLGSR